MTGTTPPRNRGAHDHPRESEWKGDRYGARGIDGSLRGRHDDEPQSDERRKPHEREDSDGDDGIEARAEEKYPHRQGRTDRQPGRSRDRPRAADNADAHDLDPTRPEDARYTSRRSRRPRDARTRPRRRAIGPTPR